MDLLKSQEINLDYILELIFEKNRKTYNKETLVQDIGRIIRSSAGNRNIKLYRRNELRCN